MQAKHGGMMVSRVGSGLRGPGLIYCFQENSIQEGQLSQNLFGVRKPIKRKEDLKNNHNLCIAAWIGKISSTGTKKKLIKKS